MATAIKAQQLSKAYQLGEFSTGTISRDIERWWALMRGKEDPFLKVGETNDRTAKGESNIVWSLKDISFEIEQGDAVGIIGRNGAGKSTLLKVLSRVTTPTTGSAKIRGRIASLLEVGTGFHPELTGRENIFLNGAILGMRKQEIKKKFDEIVNFAGVERYIDTPVKRYSSGMYVRLAFAVAAHLDSEILIVDEVLAVGDAEFQKKCLGKMGEVSKGEGRTVLFVSHNMGTIGQLCNKSILLSQGRLIKEGKTNAVVDYYINNAGSGADIIDKPGKEGENQFVKVYLANKGGEMQTEFRYDEEIVMQIHLLLDNFSEDLELAMRLTDKHKTPVFTIHEKLDKYHKRGSIIKLNITIPANFVTPGKYSWVLCINKPGAEYYDLHEDVLSFFILDTGSEFSRYEGLDYGRVFAQYSIHHIS